MSDDNVQVILVRLEHLEMVLSQIHAEVKRTNGRVTDLELQSERWKGEADGKRIQGMIATSVLSGGILAGVIWFVSQAI